MSIRLRIVSLTRAAAGALSFAITGYGIYSFIAADLRQDTVLVALYCILPTMSFAIFLLSFRWLRACAAVHSLIAAAYLAVYSLLNWRTCAELSYCDGVLNDVLRTLTTRPMEGCVAVAILNLALVVLVRANPRNANL